MWSGCGEFVSTFKSIASFAVKEMCALRGRSVKRKNRR